VIGFRPVSVRKALTVVVTNMLVVISAAGELCRVASAQVIIDDAVDQGGPAFKITTSTATYFYSKAGASLTSLVDADGVDWIDYRAEGAADAIDGSFGWFRGLPNMSRHDFGHSNGRGAVSIALDPLGQPLAKATVVSSQGPWSTRWEFFPTFARLTVTGSGDDYWLLYEGVPGGALDPADLCWSAGGEPAPCSRSWRGDIAAKPDVVPGLEWMVFADPALGRSLVLLHNDDDVADQHRLKGGMTVFGFGRSDPGPLQRIVERLGFGSGRSVGRLAGTVDTMLITFVDAVEADVVEAHIRSQAQHPSFAPANETVTADRRP
jgi:hypothetical protein